MADSAVEISSGTGIFVDTRTVGTEHRQVIVLGDPTTAGNVAKVDPTFGLEVDITNPTLSVTQSGAWSVGVTNASIPVTQSGVWSFTQSALPAGTNNIGDVDVLTVPVDPYGRTADAASQSGSISAKLRYIATTGIPITGIVTVADHNVSNAGTFATQVTSIAAGDNNIGNVDVVSMPALAAGSATIGKVDLNAGTAMVGHTGGTDYKTVAAAQTNAMLGTTGAAGDYLGGVLIIPTTTAAAAVSIKDGALTAVSIFAGATVTALSSLIPFFIPIGAKSVNAGWQVTTGTNVTAIAVGDFT